MIFVKEKEKEMNFLDEAYNGLDPLLSNLFFSLEIRRGGNVQNVNIGGFKSVTHESLTRSGPALGDEQESRKQRRYCLRCRVQHEERSPHCSPQQPASVKGNESWEISRRLESQ